jgi:hypothetical protein
LFCHDETTHDYGKAVIFIFWWSMAPRDLLYYDYNHIPVELQVMDSGSVNAVCSLGLFLVVS